MLHVKQGAKSWLIGSGYSKQIMVSGDQINCPGVVAQMIRISPGQVAHSHYHNKCTEIFFFSADNGEWVVNGQKIRPKVGDILVIQPGDHHEVSNTSAEDYCYVAFKVNVSSEPDNFKSKK